MFTPEDILYEDNHLLIVNNTAAIWCSPIRRAKARSKTR